MRQTQLPFSLYPRKLKKSKPVFYVRFRGTDGEWLGGPFFPQCKHLQNRAKTG